jgi:hypothetical protein
MENSIKKIYGNSNTKGRKRQDDINQEVINYIKTQEGYNELIFEKELKLKTPNAVGGKQTFKVDIAIYDGDKLIEVILNKAPFSNLKQNESNSIGSRVNEVFRLVNDFPNVKITWFTFSPNQTPYFKKDSLVKNIEINSHLHSICNDSFRKNISTPIELNEIFVKFDWNGIKPGQNKSEYDLLVESNQMTFTNIEIIRYIA